MILLADSHCDSLTEAKTRGFDLYNFNGQLNINKLSDYSPAIQFFAIWNRECGEKGFFRQTLDYIEFYYQQLENNKAYIESAFTSEDIIRNLTNNKISGLLSLEGGEALEGSMKNLFNLYRLGVLSVGLTWNHSNELGDGVMTPGASGLTEFGRDVVKEMGNMGMIVDVSHLSEKGFWDVYEISRNPFIASHSNSYTICPHPRNLKDKQIKTISERGGMIGINLYKYFLDINGKADIDVVLRHIDYMMNIGGDGCLGLGCDFDGMSELPAGVTGVESIGVIYNRIIKHYGERIADKIIGGNWMSFLSRELAKN